MRYPTENQRGTAQSPRFSTSGSGFDCEPPPGVWDELLRRKAHRPPPPPPVTPVKPAPPARDWRSTALAVLGVALVAVVIVSQLAHQSSQQAAAPIAAASPAPPLRVSVPSAPWPAPPPAVEVRRALPVPVPRAELVPITVRRAALMRLPSQELGVYQYYHLPVEWGGGSVLARFMGTVANFSDIPKDPTPGDMWNVLEGGSTVSLGFTGQPQQGTVIPVFIDP